MKTLDMEKMREATRLTRAGRLNDAVALLQSAAMGLTMGQRATPEIIDGEIVTDQNAPKKASVIGPQRLQSFDGVKLPGIRRRAFKADDIVPEGGRYIEGVFAN